MLPEDPEVRLRCYRNALKNWDCEGYVDFNPITRNWLASELPEYTEDGIREELYRYVEAGGKIDEKKERRPEYTTYEFHYDLRVRIGGRRVYFETILLCEDADDPDDPQIQIVSIHDV